MSGKNFLAFDLGAESGRTILGTLDNGKIEIRELNRFPTGMTNLRGRLVWNVIGFFEKMKEGLRACAAEGITEPDGIAVDTWGVDFVLLDRDGNQAGAPIAYRDKRTDGKLKEFFTVMPEDKLYNLTGIQMMQINSLIQLFAMARDNSPQLDIAHDLIFIPDYFTYLFTGKKISEFSIASTSQMFNPISKQWDQKVLDAAGISRDLMRDVVPAGTYVGDLDADICRETGIKSAKVIATAGHDTGSAIAAAPATGSGWAYISSGTWSLMGIESEHPIITEKAHEYNFSNEGGVGGTARVLKNIMGLWLIQQCRKSWSRKTDYSYAELTSMAEKSEPFRSIINPDYIKFLNPADMPQAIVEYCENTGQLAPQTPGQFMRCIIESLALKYRLVLNQLREINPEQPIDKIHIIGGGTQNELLNQFTSDASGVEVVAGPIEATAVGNILIQAMAIGAVKSRDEIREIVRNSFPMKTYQPKDGDIWDKAYSRFIKLP